MKYGTIAGVDTPASRIVFGTAFGPMLSGEGDPSELLDHAVEAGINTFDCAKEYGHAQEQLGWRTATSPSRRSTTTPARRWSAPPSTSARTPSRRPTR